MKDFVDDEAEIKIPSSIKKLLGLGTKKQSSVLHNDQRTVAMPVSVQKAAERLAGGSKEYRRYIEEQTAKTVAAGGFGVIAPEKDAQKPARIFTKSRINEYTPPKVSEGVYGFKVDAATLTDLTNSNLPELQNLEVHSGDTGNTFFVKADNNQGNKYLAQMASPEPIQVNAKTLQRILSSENNVLKNANIDVVMVDEAHPSFSERPYSVSTSNRKAYNLVRAIAVDVTTPYEGEVLSDEEVSPTTLPSNVVQFPKKTDKVRFGGLKRLAKAAAVVAAAILPWGGGVETQQAFVGEAPEVQTDIADTLIAPEVTSVIVTDFSVPVSDSFSSPKPLSVIFNIKSADITPEIVTKPAEPPSEPEIYVTQSGDTLWSIVEREFEERGIDKGEGYANMLDRMDQYIQVNQGLAYNPSGLPIDYALTIPDEDTVRADCNWTRSRGVCTPSV